MTPPDPTARKTEREFRRIYFTAAGIGSLLYVWMTTGGTFRIFGHTVAYGGGTGDFYDQQAISLLHGRWNVPVNSIGGEQFSLHRKNYGYFGPTPSLLRLPILFVFRGLAGHLDVIYSLAGLVLLIWASANLFWGVREHVTDKALTSTERGIYAALGFCLPAGSVVLFLASFTYVYHEAILWGIAFATMALATMVRRSLSLQSIGIISACSVLSFLARPSTGIICIIAAIVWGLQAFCKTPSLKTFRLGAVLAIGAVLIPMILYMGVNYAKFGTLLSLPWSHYAGVAHNPDRLKAFQHGGGLIKPRNIPTAFWEYVRPDGLMIIGRFPWIVFPNPDAHIHLIGHPVFTGIELHGSIPATMPLFTLTSIFGIVYLIRRRNLQYFLLAPIIGCAAGAVVTLSAAGITQRYLADFIPLLITLSAVGVPMIANWNFRGERVCLIGLVVISTVTNGLLAFNYQHSANETPASYRITYSQFRTGVDAFLHSKVRPIFRNPGDQKPFDAVRGDLWIPLGCDRTYWFNGNDWLELGGSNQNWTYKLDVSLNKPRVGKSYPVTARGVPGNAEFVVLMIVAKNQGVIYLDRWGQQRALGAAFPLQPDMAIDILRTHNRVEIAVNGSIVLDKNVERKVVQQKVFFGKNPIGGTTIQRTFPGTIRSEHLACPKTD